MCFSAEVSFTSAAVLGGIGIANLTLKMRKTLLLFALIPFLFSIQQFSEGLVWLNFNNPHKDSFFLEYMPHLYLIFAFLVWPVFIPLSLWFAEEDTTRKNILLIILCGGIALVGYYISMASEGKLFMQIYEHSIRYSTGVNGYPYIYAAIAILPTFVSSVKKAWVFGVLVAIGFAVTEFYFAMAFVSVWCFFAALSSIALYFILRQSSLPR